MKNSVRYLWLIYGLLLILFVGCSSKGGSNNSEAALITIDASNPSHTISPLLFGDQIEWLNSGNGIWDALGEIPRQEVIDLVSPLSLSILRYPGGTPSDFFHWDEAVGAVAGRVEQIDPWSSTTGSIVTELPVFGPDEFGRIATDLGTAIMITTNAGTGTAQDAADWLTYYKGNGINAEYWEIGNEVYLAGSDYSASEVRMTPLEYAQVFDDFAQALRLVDSSIKVGIIGGIDTGLLTMFENPDWTRIVLENVTQPIDFIAVHNSYAPGVWSYDVDETKVFKSLLAAPEYIRDNFQQLESLIDQYAPSESLNMDIAVTEHASFFSNDPSEEISLQILNMERNRVLGSALFSALSYNIFIANPKVSIANHTNINSPYWQAALTTDVDGFSSPIPSAFYYVIQLYAETAGGQYIPLELTNVPTFDSVDYGIVPAQADVASLDAIAVLSAASDRFWLYVVNRDLTRNITAHILVDGLPLPSVQSVTAEVVNGPNYDASNTIASPDTVTLTTTSLSPSTDFVHTFPAHSLTRITIE